MESKFKLFCLCFVLTGILTSEAQDMLVATKVSQRASITQRIGTTDVTVVYHSPSAKKRKIFGGIVPYDFVVDGVEYPWRAGSNQNTTVEFTHNVKIQGQPLAKGKYGLHIFVKEKEWVFIFSKNSENWGSFSYKKEEDALRVDAKPETSAYQENLRYEFNNLQPQSARLELKWSTMICGIEISVDVNANVLADLKAKEEKTVDNFVKIAQLTVAENPANVDEALSYVDQSLEIGSEFRNTMLKSQLLAQQGKNVESKKYEEQSLTLGKGFPYFYYYPLSYMLLEGDTQKTYELLSEMLLKEPDNWIANLAMGEYYIKVQDQEKATFHFGKAYEHAGERSKNYARYMYLSNKLILEQ
ncbi:DUF2911 domain-containing protein [Flagellimonas algicola]|uniref:DUF2911 domain-containing protein n=1 Tax=Flagellimonas algicola TaxID=2583815 RepID=A0ABY2WNH7_9FLAO|nr:DUF2911 domain-containing protein [Allomuricauda algicola]TMU56554.1 DUF2911 domain-containing protein [Allomuricauda algicola]